jgi:hypothetical protein
MAEPAWSNGSKPSMIKLAATPTPLSKVPLPVARYRSTLHVSEKADGRGCTVEWSSDFEPSGASESDAVKAIRGVYEAGFDNLRKMFGS